MIQGASPTRESQIDFPLFAPPVMLATSCSSPTRSDLTYDFTFANLAYLTRERRAGLVGCHRVDPSRPGGSPIDFARVQFLHVVVRIRSIGI